MRGSLRARGFGIAVAGCAVWGERCGFQGKVFSAGAPREAQSGHIAIAMPLTEVGHTNVSLSACLSSAPPLLFFPHALDRLRACEALVFGVGDGIASSHALGVQPNALVRMAQEPREVMPVLSLHAPGLPLERPVDVANGLSIGQLLLAQLVAVLAEVTGMPTAREALVRPRAPAAPAEVAGGRLLTPRPHRTGT